MSLRNIDGPGHMPSGLDLGLEMFMGSTTDTAPAEAAATNQVTDTRPAVEVRSQVFERESAPIQFVPPNNKPYNSLRKAASRHINQVDDILGEHNINLVPAPSGAASNSFQPPVASYKTINQVSPVVENTTAEEVPLKDKPYDQLTSKEREERFNLALAEHRHLQRLGCQSSRGFGFSSELEELEQEVKRLRAQRNKDLMVRDMNRGVVYLAGITERLNSRFNPFGMDLVGFGEATLANIDEFDDIHRELYDKYLVGTEYPPELRWVKTFVSGAMAYSDERARMKRDAADQPKIQDEIAEALNYHPELKAHLEHAIVELRERQNMGINNIPLRAASSLPPQETEPTIPFPPEAYHATTPAKPVKRPKRRRIQSTAPRTPAEDTDDDEVGVMLAPPQRLKQRSVSFKPEASAVPQVGHLRPANHQQLFLNPSQDNQEINMSEAESLTDMLN